MDETVGANWFAYVAILSWPAVALALYSTRRFSEATAWTILGALLLLPQQVGIKFQMIPSVDKGTVASLSAILGCVLFRPRLDQATSLGWLTTAFALLYVLSPLVTSSLNNDVVAVGPLTLPGVGYYDGISAMISQTILVAPFFVGRRFLTNSESIETLLRVLVIGALAYSLPMLYEIRMSPQLSLWIYGTFSSSFPVEVRYGGYRPVVFMQNGLTTAFFLATAILASIAFWRLRTRITGALPSLLTGYLGLILVLCKSAGALIYSIVFGVLVQLCSPKLQVRVALVLACIAFTYPLLRINALVPTEQLLDLAGSFNSERAASLKTRFDQEEQLLAHASERFWFGWGRYGRNRVYDKYGNDISITDGQWIITFGQFGFLGFIAQFGLLVIPVLYSARALKFARSESEMILLSCLSLIVGIHAFEQIPNASISGWSWLLAGSLLGRCLIVRSGSRGGIVHRAKNPNAAQAVKLLGGPVRFKS